MCVCTCASRLWRVREGRVARASEHYDETQRKNSWLLLNTVANQGYQSSLHFKDTLLSVSSPQNHTTIVLLFCSAHTHTHTLQPPPLQSIFSAPWIMKKGKWNIKHTLLAPKGLHTSCTHTTEMLHKNSHVPRLLADVCATRPQHVHSLGSLLLGVKTCFTAELSGTQSLMKLNCGDFSMMTPKAQPSRSCSARVESKQNQKNLIYFYVQGWVLLLV